MMTTEPTPAEWSFVKKLGFRFLFCYFVLYFFPLPSGLAEPGQVSGIFDRPWQAIVGWVAKHVLHLQLAGIDAGSGDRTYDYLRVLCMAVLALVAAAIWSLRSHRKEHAALHAWARLWLRFALAAAMFTYGTYKVIKLQFPNPGYYKLTETYGNSTPMGLLWAFMGYSRGYTFFAGAGEMMAGALLCFRRTATLGALVAIAVLSNVVVLNFCYDVPVKLGSSHLLLLAFFLAAPEARRLAGFFLLNRTVQPAALGPEVTKAWMRRAGLALKAAVIATIVAAPMMNAVGALRAMRHSKGPVPPDGFYTVDRLEEDGVVMPPLADDPHRWRTFILLRGYVRTWNMDGSTEVFQARGDARTGPLTLVPLDARSGETAPDGDMAGILTLRPPADGMPGAITGTFRGKALRAVISLQNHDTSRFPLMKRGFHWINEYPDNN